MPGTSIFPTIEEAAGFFSLGATGYSATREAGRFHGMELRCLDWTIQPLTVDEARSRFFGDAERFPPGSVELDCALLMRGVAHNGIAARISGQGSDDPRSFRNEYEK